MPQWSPSSNLLATAVGSSRRFIICASSHSLQIIRLITLMYVPAGNSRERWGKELLMIPTVQEFKAYQQGSH